MRISLTRVLGGAAVTAATCLTIGVGSASALPGPPTDSFATAFGYSLIAPNADTPGANDWSCDPSGSPFGMVQSPRSRLAKNGPPGCASSTSRRPSALATPDHR